MTSTSVLCCFVTQKLFSNSHCKWLCLCLCLIKFKHSSIRSFIWWYKWCKLHCNCFGCLDVWLFLWYNCFVLELMIYIIWCKIISKILKTVTTKTHVLLSVLMDMPCSHTNIYIVGYSRCAQMHNKRMYIWDVWMLVYIVIYFT